MISAVNFKNRDVKASSPPIIQQEGTRERPTRRSLFYFIAYFFLFVGTLFVLIALFTNNWMRTASKLVNNLYYTYGLWFVCARLNFSWYTNKTPYQGGFPIYPGSIPNGFQSYQSYIDNLCLSMNYDSVSFIYACQVFYCIAAILNFLALCLATIGICIDLAKSRQCVPSAMLWTLLISVLSQVIAVAVYGGAGIGNYKLYEPDYSFVLACIAIGFNFLAAILFAIECIYSGRKKY